MLVKNNDVNDVVNYLLVAKKLAVDTETTGLSSFKGERLFSIIISTEVDNYYFNFQDYPKEGVQSLNREVVVNKLKNVFGATDKEWFLQNAKFDLHMLAKEGLFISGKVYDLMFLDRIHCNQHMSYKLKDITKRWGDEKLDTVWEYIKENGLISKVENEALRKTSENPHFDEVPLSLIQPYGEQDGAGTLNVGMKILEAIKKEDELVLQKEVPKQMSVVENETKLVKTLFNMEQLGVRVDLGYSNKALEHYFGIVDGLMLKFKELTGVDFVKGTTVFEEVFASEKDRWAKTEKGKWKWDADTLRGFDNPAAKIAIQYSEAKKQSEYFANFLFYADDSGILHPDFQQAGTVTSRLSCRDPNLQNLSSPDKYESESEASLYPIRRAIIPREGFFFVMLDYSQVEFRILLDLAGANSLINEVLNGLDVHSATAKISGTSRKEAKTNNFLTAYGGGVVKLASNLYDTRGSREQLGAIYKKMFGWRLSDGEKAAWPTVTSELRDYNTPLIQKAYDIQQSIFRSAPEIKDLLKTVQRVAETRGYVRNWLGRRYQFQDKRFCYTAPNHIIQGGSAEVIKIAMNGTDECLEDTESKMLLSVHDELILEVKFGEEYVVHEVKKIMESIYPYKRLPLLVDIEYSYKNLGDKESWPPPHLTGGRETRNEIPAEAESRT